MQILFDEIMPKHAIELIQDVFGNYVSSRRFVLSRSTDYGNRSSKNSSSTVTPRKSYCSRLPWKAIYWHCLSRCTAAASCKR